MHAQFLRPAKAMIDQAERMMPALQRAVAYCGDFVSVVNEYSPSMHPDILVLYGIGAPERNAARNAHLASNIHHHVLIWDLGYFGPDFNRDKYLRCSLDEDHPHKWMDYTPAEPGRWAAIKTPLRNDFNPDGHIILVGLGQKSRVYLNEPDWEADKLVELRARFPGREIVYRPKPGSKSPHLDVTTNTDTPIHELLKGASLISCRHSNVAVDAVIAGVPFECENGIALWLQNRLGTTAREVPSKEERLDFLRKVAHWQWRVEESVSAWQFIKSVIAAAP